MNGQNVQQARTEDMIFTVGNYKPSVSSWGLIAPSEKCQTEEEIAVEMMESSQSSLLEGECSGNQSINQSIIANFYDNLRACLALDVYVLPLLIFRSVQIIPEKFVCHCK